MEPTRCNSITHKNPHPGAAAKPAAKTGSEDAAYKNALDKLLGPDPLEREFGHRGDIQQKLDMFNEAHRLDIQYPSDADKFLAYITQLHSGITNALGK